MTCSRLSSTDRFAGQSTRSRCLAGLRLERLLWRLFFPTQPGRLLFKGGGNAFERGNGGEANVYEGYYMFAWRQSQPALDTRIIGSVAGTPHTGKSHLFSSKEHVLNGGSHSLDILDLQDVGLARELRRYCNDDGRTQELRTLLIQLCLRLVACCFIQVRGKRFGHDEA